METSDLNPCAQPRALAVGSAEMHAAPMTTAVNAQHNTYGCIWCPERLNGMQKVEETVVRTLKESERSPQLLVTTLSQHFPVRVNHGHPWG